MNVNKQAILALAALCVLAVGHSGRATEQPDLALSQRRKIALPIWNSLVRTTPAHPYECMLLIEVLATDAFMHDTIAPERLAAAKVEAVRSSSHPRYGKDFYLGAIALLQRMVGDEAGFRETRAMVDVSHVDDKLREQLTEDRMTLLRSVPAASTSLKGVPSASDMPNVPSDDLKPFISLYHQILQSPKGKKEGYTAAMRKRIRRAVKRADSLGVGSDTALGLIASAQARTGDVVGACETARHCGVNSYGEYETLLRITRIQMDYGDLVGARRTLDKVGPHSGNKSDVVEALALAQLRAGDGAAALQTLDTTPEADERSGNKCDCLVQFLQALYIKHALR